MELTDRELIELAAKAAGITGYWVSNFGSGDYYYRGNTDGIYHEYPDGGYTVWNPTTDDGDALRLAVKLRINTDFDQQKPNLDAPFIMRYVNAIGEGCQIGSSEKFGSDPYAATRRAIVRAAAEIGKRMVTHEENNALVKKLRGG